MKKLLFLLITTLCVLGVPSGVMAENWVRVSGNLYVDEETAFTDSDGYIRYKSRELDDYGQVKYQHKEAIHCEKAKPWHFFRGMYGADAYVNNKDDSDITWTDWRANPREAWDEGRLMDLDEYFCGWW